MSAQTLPAEPILASALWRVQQAEPPVPRLLTGCRSIDAALAPGLPYGQGGVVCISSEDNAGSTELLNTLLASHLLSTRGSATIIDPQSFPIPQLYTHLQSTPAPDPAQLLARVSVSRVFSIKGLLAALADLRASLSSVPDSQPSPAPIGSEELTPTPHLLLIPGLDTPLLPLHRASASHAAAFVADLLRSLRHLARMGVVCVLAAGVGRGRSPSVFASCTARPAFDALLGRAEVHVLVHRVPRGVRDAERIYGAAGSGGKWVSCLEVLRDVHGSRRGRYGFFVTNGTGGVRDM